MPSLHKRLLVFYALIVCIIVGLIFFVHYHPTSSSGFPSGHVVHYVVFFGFLLTVMLVHKNISLFLKIFVGTLSAFLILAISISRIYIGAHWATDVMGGYLFGFIYLGIILKLYLKDIKFNRS